MNFRYTILTNVFLYIGHSAPQSPTDLGSSDGSGFPATPGSLPKQSSKHRMSMSMNDSQKARRQSSTPTAATKVSSWETLVLFAVNLSRLDLQVNMSNVMGNTV